MMRNIPSEHEVAPLKYETIKNWAFKPVEQTYTQRDTMLYALGLGFGADPLDEKELRFVYEKELRALPTYGVVLATPGLWISDPKAEIDWVKLVHGEQSLVLHKPMPTAATLVSHARIKSVVDKGAGKGALIVLERILTEKSSGERIATSDAVLFARGDGGLSQSDDAPPAPPPVPEGTPDEVCDIETLPRQALIYRLSGDYNPLHVDPAVGQKAGFKQPILHGLCTYGLAGRAVLKTICDYDTSKLSSLSVRFSSPVYPGETIRTEMYRDGGRVLFRSRAVERNVVVLNNGVATLN